MKHYSEEFIKRCSKGDKQLQKQLFEELYATMYRICYRYLNDQPEAEDTVMKGFMLAFQKMDKFRYQSDHGLFMWIRRIMVNEALTALRKRHNFLLTLEEQYTEIAVQEDVFSRLSAEELESLICSLPTGYRTVFNLFVTEGYEHREIAKELGISEGTSKSQLAKARVKLRNLVEHQRVNYVERR